MSRKLRVIDENGEFLPVWENFLDYCYDGDDDVDIWSRANDWNMSDIYGQDFVKFKKEEDMIHFVLKFS